MDQILGKAFRPKKIIDNPSEESLREWALEHGGVITEFGNLSVTTSVRNRMAKLTEVIMDRPDPDDLELVLGPEPGPDIAHADRIRHQAYRLTVISR